MNENIKRISEKYFFELILSSLLGKTPENPYENVDYRYIFTTAKYHDVLALCAESLEKLGDIIPEIVRINFDKANKKAMLVEAVQQFELEKITSRFESEKIQYMPLKGSVIKNFYPKPHMRRMSDIDILLKKSDMKKADEIMKSLGYTLKIQANKEHIFVKPPHMNVELHWKLIDENKNRRLEKYFGNGWQRAIKVGEYGYKFSNEDFFIYTIGHLAMHFFANGIGIRAFLDIWVYLKRFSDKLDFDYINAELKKCGLYDFCINAENLVYHIIENTEPTPLIEEMFAFVMNSGSIGTLETSHLSEAGKGKNISFQKFKIILRRIFPDMTRMKKAYPILAKAPLLLPICWICRIFSGVFGGKSDIKKSFGSVMDYEDEKIKKLADFYKRCGL